jgi:hypothetical protein
VITGGEVGHVLLLVTKKGLGYCGDYVLVVGKITEGVCEHEHEPESEERVQ